MPKVIEVKGRQTRSITLKGQNDYIIRFEPGSSLEVGGSSHAIHIERSNKIRIEGKGTIKGFIGIWIGNTTGGWDDIYITDVSIIACKQQGLLGVNAKGVTLDGIKVRNVAVQHAVYFGNIGGGYTSNIRMKGCDLRQTKLACLQFNAESASRQCGPCQVMDTTVENPFALNLLSVDPISFQRCTINGAVHADHTSGRNWPTRGTYDSATKFGGGRRPLEIGNSTFRRV